LIVKVKSSAVIGIDPYPVDVEVDIASGLPQFSTVGLPDAAVKESKDRIKAAIKNSGYRFPEKRVTVNLAPADIKKEGTAFDLPIAVGILAAEGLIDPAKLKDYLIMGELSLDGGIKAIHGVLSAAFQAKASGIAGIIVPGDNAREAAMVEGLPVFGTKTLSEIVEFIGGRKEIRPAKVQVAEVFKKSLQYSVDFSEIQGQDQAKRAFEVAAAGGHNILMVGPPGAGKTMLAQRIPTVLPDLTFEEAIEVTKIYSVAGLLNRKEIFWGTRPFRAPHHTISDAGLVGGGHVPRPGEISLAHHGVLFLDELSEFKKHVLEVLRQPLEDGYVVITRSVITTTYPARFTLVAAMNPCPCGYYGDPRRECGCTLRQIRQYKSKISGPLLDRIDIHVEVPSVKYRELAAKSGGEDSAQIKNRVEVAREIQRKRFQGHGARTNAHMTGRQIKQFCALGGESQALLEMAMEKLGLSARAYTRILKVARTIADLEGEEEISSGHISEAIQYRSLDRKSI
jgi:magnesium chelatase family protein